MIQGVAAEWSFSSLSAPKGVDCAHCAQSTPFSFLKRIPDPFGENNSSKSDQAMIIDSTSILKGKYGLNSHRNHRQSVYFGLVYRTPRSRSFAYISPEVPE